MKREKKYERRRRRKKGWNLGAMRKGCFLGSWLREVSEWFVRLLIMFRSDKES